MSERKNTYFSPAFKVGPDSVFITYDYGNGTSTHHYWSEEAARECVSREIRFVHERFNRKAPFGFWRIKECKAVANG